MKFKIKNEMVGMMVNVLSYHIFLKPDAFK